MFYLYSSIYFTKKLQKSTVKGWPQHKGPRVQKQVGYVNSVSQLLYIFIRHMRGKRARVVGI